MQSSILNPRGSTRTSIHVYSASRWPGSVGDEAEARQEWVVLYVANHHTIGTDQSILRSQTEPLFVFERRITSTGHPRWVFVICWAGFEYRTRTR